MENFIVSARKYRPATFASVVGQKHITSTLKNAIERGQLAHAYLFCGPRGVGKTTCARIFAKAINCLNPNGAEACNQCESCRSFNENRSLNIHELDAASNNSVDDIRNLIDQVRVMPQQGRYSVFIIDEVHMLSTQAFNAFLKTLEEPPAHAIFILATTEKHKILPTILSRCQIYDFNRIRVEDGVEYLRYIASQEGVEADDQALNLIARKADGGMRDALSMFDKAVSFCGSKLDYKQVAATLNVLDYDTYFDITDLLFAGRYIDALVRFDDVLSRGFSAQTFIAGLNQHMRDLLMARGAAISLIEFTGTLLERYRRQAEQCNESFLFGAISLLTEADGRIRQSSNQRLLVELGLMKIAGLGQKKNYDTDALTLNVSAPLPELNAAQPRNTAPAAPQPQPQTAQAPQPDTAPQQAQPRQAMPQQTAPQPGQQSATTAPPQTDAVRPQPAAAVSQPKPQSAGRSGKPLVSGTSLADLLGGDEQAEMQAEAAAVKSESTAQLHVDPEAESKLKASAQGILDYIGRSRPRFMAAFDSMRIGGNTIRIAAPTRTLADDIMHSKTELMMQIAAIAGVDGFIDLQVDINEQIRAAKPIKLEDRLQHMIRKNPLIVEMRDALDLEAE
ncbi:MAG: DNA polymerase III subunit gamma/tau [Alistipes sp.]|nr:DNA polymerase III subunit gamma/tau [Alistipes sp.]